MSARSDEIWEQLLQLDADQLRASIRECERYLSSPEGIAEFGLCEILSQAESRQIIDEAWAAIAPRAEMSEAVR